ncbi:shikimate dehydrogenase family protein [Adlercreutzia agrestimuris]|uniref:shikimate dehydrogenase family protein n=1 Tax=Adlercreutzia agrestimuris TaxID=2941324 RepID=UPI0020403356|nr:shikimate dehydrogenase [Adlercreutzia agrestimuris]
MSSFASQNLYLLGHPISHSKSPVMYNAVYEKLGLAWQYGLADVPTKAEAEAFLAARDFLSLNITTPYKPQAFEAATAKAASAKLALGANVLVNHNDELIAFNTDGRGCVAYLERSGFSFSGAKVVVCGTGPTALAILHECAAAGAAQVTLLGRNKTRTHDILNAYVERLQNLAYATIDLPPAQAGYRSLRQIYKEPTLKFGTYESSKNALSSADLIINATPCGMQKDDGAPFDTELLRANQVVFDCVYGHGETALVAGARKHDCVAYDGAGMLVAQAVATVGIVCDIAGVNLTLSDDELFNLMAAAAGFDV